MGYGTASSSPTATRSTKYWPRSCHLRLAGTYQRPLPARPGSPLPAACLLLTCMTPLPPLPRVSLSLPLCTGETGEPASLGRALEVAVEPTLGAVPRLAISDGRRWGGPGAYQPELHLGTPQILLQNSPSTRPLIHWGRRRVQVAVAGPTSRRRRRPLLLLSARCWSTGHLVVVQHPAGHMDCSVTPPWDYPCAPGPRGETKPLSAMEFLSRGIA